MTFDELSTALELDQDQALLLNHFVAERDQQQAALYLDAFERLQKRAAADRRRAYFATAATLVVMTLVMNYLR